MFPNINWHTKLSFPVSNCSRWNSLPHWQTDQLVTVIPTPKALPSSDMSSNFLERTTEIPAHSLSSPPPLNVLQVANLTSFWSIIFSFVGATLPSLAAGASPPSPFALTHWVVVFISLYQQLLSMTSGFDELHPVDFFLLAIPFQVSGLLNESVTSHVAPDTFKVAPEKIASPSGSRKYRASNSDLFYGSSTFLGDALVFNPPSCRLCRTLSD
jgi:hypothetical protein